MAVFELGPDRITVSATGVEIDTPGTPLDMSWGCDLSTFLHPDKGQTYRNAVERALGDDGLAEVMAVAQEAFAALPPPPPDPAAVVFPAEMAALVAQARSAAAVLAMATGFPKYLTELDFFGVADETTVPLDPHESGHTTRIRAVHVVGGREIGLEASASWWNENELASADIRVYTVDRSSDPPAYLSLSLAAPWTEVLFMAKHASAIWEMVGWNMARSDFPGKDARRITP